MDDNKVAVLIEDLMSQFRTFGEGLQMLNDKVEKGFADVNDRIDRIDHKLEKQIEQNHQEHQQLKQMVKELDSEVARARASKSNG